MSLSHDKILEILNTTGHTSFGDLIEDESWYEFVEQAADKLLEEVRNAS